MQGLASRTALSRRFHGEGGLPDAAPYIVKDCKRIIRSSRAGKMMQK